MQSKLKNLNEYSTTPCAIAKKKYIFSNNKRYFSCIKGSDVDLLKLFEIAATKYKMLHFNSDCMLQVECYFSVEMELIFILNISIYCCKKCLETQSQPN